MGKETAFTKASDAIYPAYVRPRLPLALGIASLAALAVFFALRGAIADESVRTPAATGSVDPLGALWIMGVPRPPAPEMSLPQALDVIGALQKIAAFAAPPRAEPTTAAQSAVRAQAPAAQPAAAPPAAWLDRDFAAGVLAGVNAQRRAAGLAPLVYDGALARAAEGYAQTMARYNWFNHTGPDGSSFADRIRAAGFTANVALGEALAAGDGSWTAANFVQLWMGSAAHRDLLLGAYARAGVGCHFQREGGGVTVRCVLDVAG